ncbi:hypothetical protein [Candidatus Sneabacter namystus]|uniref:Uncharacterized protein n=1 Tax=Candidatus Sneabacter namystus TaxID=2601646 RepID=A0A5C0UI63_9RICK|nr:hypothetical protein [Candidatus Sneabacter namystus]QEK39440.1 hypothetical protein FZC37_00595 [Candidatus Sneabacter namystus]
MVKGAKKKKKKISFLMADKEVRPVKFIGLNASYMAVGDKDSKPVLENDMPLAWSKAIKSGVVKLD